MPTVVRTESGKNYSLIRRKSGFYGLDGNTDVAVAFVGDMREDLCKEAMKGTRKIIKALDPSGEHAVGFTNTSATLSATPPRKGFKMFIFSVSEAKPLRLTTKIVSVN